MSRVHLFLTILLLGIPSNFSSLPAIILCTGPSLGRKQLLLETIEKDRLQVPFKKIFLATNDQANLTLDVSGIPIETTFFNPLGKQLDCLNCIILSIQHALADCEVHDDDIILFKHESVFISDMYLLTKAIDTLHKGFEMVIKYWIGDPEPGPRLTSYYHTDSFLITVAAARKAFTHQPYITGFTEEYQFCEEYFTKYIVSLLPHVYKLDYHHSSWKDNELGLYHIPRYEESAEWYWNKSNYHNLYKD